MTLAKLANRNFEAERNVEHAEERRIVHPTDRVLKFTDLNQQDYTPLKLPRKP
jgi:hypothetical protein